MTSQHELDKKICQQIKRIKKAQMDGPNIYSQSIFIGTLGLVLVLPIIGGVYLGYWLDSLMAGYSSRWTLSLLFVGIIVGVLNVYFLIKD
jgi:ATP synthase protein I